MMSSPLPLLLAALALAPALQTRMTVDEPPPVASSDERHHEATGVIRKIASDRSYVVIAHDEIPGLMKAMTMPFDLRSPSLLDGLSRGDSVRFVFSVNGGGRHVIEQIQKR